jgi:hypothetical protein
VLVVLVLAPVPKSVIVGRRQTAADRLIEFSVPYSDLAVDTAADLVFAIQIRDRTGHPVETLPEAGQWTLAIPMDG